MQFWSLPLVFAKVHYMEGIMFKIWLFNNLDAIFITVTWLGFCALGMYVVASV